MSCENDVPWCDGLPTDTPEEFASRKLNALQVGDIFHARPSSVAGMPFLVTAATKSKITARAMTSQFPLTFDRKTGEGSLTLEPMVRNQVWRITSVQPLPLEIHNLMLSFDRRMRLGGNGTTNPLDEGDKRAVLYLHEHYTAYPLWKAPTEV